MMQLDIVSGCHKSRELCEVLGDGREDSSIDAATLGPPDLLRASCEDRAFHRSVSYDFSVSW